MFGKKKFPKGPLFREDAVAGDEEKRTLDIATEFVNKCDEYKLTENGVRAVAQWMETLIASVEECQKEPL